MRLTPRLAYFGLLIVAHVQAQQTILDLISTRRKSDLAQTVGASDIASIPTWLTSQSSNGTWGDVDYTSGCAARMSPTCQTTLIVVEKSTWPIQGHWKRIIAFASVWSGLNPSSPANYTASPQVLDAALKGLDWWFERDFTSMDCIGQGGLT